jgi:PIN domain nuclease of toxin-antitoxin system
VTYEALVTDTHPLIWYFCTDQHKLSKKARHAFDDAVKKQTKAIYVPTPVLWEMSILIDDNRIRISIPFVAMLDKLFKNQMIIEQPFDRQILAEYHGLHFGNDPFDKAIVATALLLDMPLVTADGIIHDTRPCDLFW